MLFLSVSCSRSLPGPEQDVPPPSNSAKYDLTFDWFTSAVPIWTELLAPMRGKPDLRYLEIGVFEGRSALWMLENILTHPSARLTAVDLFADDLEQRFRANLDRSGQAAKATILKGRSQHVLRGLDIESFDIIYIDGGHTADNVLADLVLSWDLVKPGGLVILDDYGWKDKELPDELRPQVAVDAFITANRNYLEVVHRGYQAILKKGADFRTSDYSSYIGKYEYQWLTGVLFSAENGQPVPLSETERDLLQNILRSKPFGDRVITLDREIAADPRVRRLLERLDAAGEVRFSGRVSGTFPREGLYAAGGFGAGILLTFALRRWRRRNT
jgi:predicted O-methyltransferase YrrM